MELGDVGQICVELEFPSKCPARQQHLDRLCVLEPGAVVLVAMLFLKHSFYLYSVKELRKNLCFSTSYAVLLVHVVSSTFYERHQEYGLRNPNISAIRNTTFTSILVCHHPPLKKRLDCFCSYLGSFVSLPHVPYFSDTVLTFRMACQLRVPDLFHGIQLGLLNMTKFESLPCSELRYFVQIIQHPGYSLRNVLSTVPALYCTYIMF